VPGGILSFVEESKMKLRNGFVSNSSSSSFVITDASEGYISLDEFGDTLHAYDIGEIEFGWGPEKIEDVGSRINWAYLQSRYANPEEEDPLLEKASVAVYGVRNKHLEMLEEVIKENSSIKEIDWRCVFEDGSIDHQSSAAEGENMEIFESKQALKDFIFGKGSYIQLDNDNH
jgi:hypothetical protein